MTHHTHVRTISSLDLPELRPYRTLRRPREHLQDGIFVAEGEKVVRRLLDSGIQVLSVLLTEEWFEALIHDGAKIRELPHDVFIAERNVLQQIVGYNVHQGIMAVGHVPAEPSLEQTIAFIPSSHLIVALDGLSQAENVGVITRNCVAFGVDAIVSGERSCSPYLRRAVRNSMGAVFKVPIIHAKDLRESLLTLRMQYGTRVLATDPHSALSIASATLTGSVCIVLGNEDGGVSEEILCMSDERIAIPMQRETDSLNVGSASAVCLYEASKQRMRII